MRGCQRKRIDLRTGMVYHTSMTDQKTSSHKKGLSVKERLFARYKAKGFSNGKSAELAGYKAGTSADKQGYRLSKKADIQEEVSRILSEQETRSLIDRETHLDELAKLRDKAVDTGQIGSAVTAEHYRGKVANLYTERLEVSETNKETSDEIMLRISKLLGNDSKDKDKSLH